MKPKILIYSTAYYPFVGGAEVAIKEITDRLSDYEFDLITAKFDFSLPAQEKIGAVTVYRIGLGIKFIDKIWLAFWGGYFGRRLAKQKKYDMVWSMMASFSGFAALTFKSGNPGVPFLLTLQEGDELGRPLRRSLFMRGRFYDIFRHADRIQCISTYLADWAKAMGAIAPIDVVPNGVDLAKVSMALPDAERYKQEYKEEKVIITTSRLVPKNGIADLIKAMSYLPKDIKLQICGIGPEQDRLEALVRRLGLSNRVIFLGFIKGEEIFSYLAKADIFVRPSLSEGLGNSFLEAMALGLPTVGTPVGGIVDFLKDGETGWLVNVSDPKSIAKKVSYILDPIHKDAVEKVVARGAEVVGERYDWDKVAAEMGKIFEGLA